MNKYDAWLESGAEQQTGGDQQEYIWHNYMKPGEDYDVMERNNFLEYLDKATASREGDEKWQNLRQYADRGEWETFGRAIYFLVHDYIEDELS